MEVSLKILGSSSAIPTLGRNPTSQFLTIADRHFLIDCGEGTQVQLRKYGIGFSRINHILISHLHGDHFYGLIPLLSTLHLLDRHKELHLYGPPALEEGFKNLLRLSHSTLRFPIVFHALNMKERALIYEDKAITIHSIPLKHSIDCCGFLFKEKTRPRNFKKEVLSKYSIPTSEIRKIKTGADWIDEDGNTILNKELTTPPAASLSYAYCTDTVPIEKLAQLLDTKPDLLYHEATFAEEHAKRATQTKHSTASQAAKVAKSVSASKLILGHFSVRYDDLNILLEEARTTFKNTYLAREGYHFRMRTTEKLEVETLGS